MKHGIYYAYWEQEWNADYSYYIEKVKRLGFDILEISAAPLRKFTQKEIQRLRQCAMANEIEMTAGYGPTYDKNLATPDKMVRRHVLDFYKEIFEKMEALDIHVLGGGLHSYWPLDVSKTFDKKEDWKYSVEGIHSLAVEAQKYKINLGMEVLNRFEGYLLNTAEEGVRFVQDVDEDNVKVMLDTFHMNIEENDIGEAIRKTGSYLGHLHTGECNRMVPGKGRIPWREIGRALYDIRYEGAVVMEPFVKMGGQVGQDIRVWRDISKGADEERLDRDAEEALEFQKYMLDWVEK